MNFSIIKSCFAKKSLRYKQHCDYQRSPFLTKLYLGGHLIASVLVTSIHLEFLGVGGGNNSDVGFIIFSSLVIIFGIILSIFTGLLLRNEYHKIKDKVVPENGEFAARSILSNAQTIFVIACTIYWIMCFEAGSIAAYRHEKICGFEGAILKTLFCRTVSDKTAFPGVYGAALLFFPLGFLYLFRGVNNAVAILILLSQILSVAASLFVFAQHAVVPTLIMYSLFAMILLVQSDLHLSALFDATTAVPDKFTNKEVTHMTNLSSKVEMRHMIGNLAHDLKTPLASFTTGTDSCLDILNEALDLLGCLKHGQAPSQLLKELLKSAQTVMDDVRNTNSFMLMTINRCIDFTKASKGVKLVSKPETIDLEETVTLPLRIMRDMSARISLEMDRLSPDICSHIITDQQWLQENLLCLLSNAVKYSSRGKITVSIKLRSAEQLLPPNTLNMDVSCDSEQQGGDAFQQPDPTLSCWSEERRVLDGALGIEISTGVADISARASGNREKKKDAEKSEGEGEREAEVVASNPGQLSRLTSCPSVSEDHRIASSSGEGEGTTGTGTSTHVAVGTFLLIEVTDTGVGLSDAEMKSLFSPFKQAQRLAGGTGLGLFSLAKRIEAINGLYGVSSRPDGQRGSVFWFAVPYRPDELSAQINATAQMIREVNSEFAIVGENADGLESSSQRPLGLVITGENSYGLVGLFDDRDVDESMPKANDDAVLAGSSSSSNAAVRQAAGCSGKIIVAAATNPSLAEAEVRHDAPICTTAEPEAPSQAAQTARAPTVGNLPSLPSAESATSQQLHVLVVDDSLSIQKMSKMVLKRLGYTVEQAENGLEALEMMQERYEQEQSLYDVVLMDMQMPVLDGLEATRRLRVQEQLDPAAKAFSKTTTFMQQRVYIADPLPPSNAAAAITANGGGGGGDGGGTSLSGSKNHAADDIIEQKYDEAAEVGDAGKMKFDPKRGWLGPRHQLVIGCSACSDQETMDEALAAGMDAVIPKPFSIQKLQDVLQGLRY